MYGIDTFPHKAFFFKLVKYLTAVSTITGYYEIELKALLNH